MEKEITMMLTNPCTILLATCILGVLVLDEHKLYNICKHLLGERFVKSIVGDRYEV